MKRSIKVHDNLVVSFCLKAFARYQLPSVELNLSHTN